MNSTLVFFLVFGIGMVAGLRTMTAPAVVSWAAHLKWLKVEDSALAFMGSIAAVASFTLLAVGELIADQSSKIGKRTAAGPLTGRMIMGGLSGATICAAASQPILLGAVLGGLGGIVGAFAGYGARTGLVKKLGVADVIIAVPEDLVAIGVGLYLVSRI